MHTLRLVLIVASLAGSIPVEALHGDLRPFCADSKAAVDRHTCSADEKHNPLPALHSCATGGVPGPRGEALLPGGDPAAEAAARQQITPGTPPRAARDSFLAVNVMRGPPSA